jgi:hypothetical protein
MILTIFFEKVLKRTTPDDIPAKGPAGWPNYKAPVRGIEQGMRVGRFCPIYNSI